MRKHLTRIAILALLSIGLIGITGAAPASAANCTAWESTTYWNGWLNFQGHLSACTDVEQVQFGFPGSPVGTAGWFDVTWNTAYLADGVAGGGQYQDIINYGTDAYVIYEHNAWCGGANHVVWTGFGYRIKRKATHTWGAWYARSPTPYHILC